MLRTLKRPFDVAAFALKYNHQFDQLGTSLACNFDTPAQRLINCAFSAIGEQRFVGKDDRWEQVTAHLSGSEYIQPPKRLMERWARY